MLDKVKKIKGSIGLSLVLCGVPLSMLLNFLYPQVNWTPIIMIISIFCLISKETFKLRSEIHKEGNLIISFQILMLVYLYLTEDKWFNVGTFVSFHIYVIAVCLLMSKNPSLRDIDFSDTLFFLSGILSSVFAVIHFTGIYALERSINQEDNVLEVFTMNIAAFTNMMLCIFKLKDSKFFMRIFLFLLLVVDFYVIVESGKRSYFISIFAALFVYTKRRRIPIKSLLFYGTVSIIILFCFEPVREAFSNLFLNTINGFNDVFVSKSVEYDENSSSAIRRDLQEIALKRMDTEFSFYNYFIGGGYFFGFSDNPLLESYLDMGIIGFVFYSYLILFLPLKFYKRLDVNNKCHLLAMMLSVMNITICITNNSPYQYFVYTPICLISMYLAYGRKTRKVFVS